MYFAPTAACSALFVRRAEVVALPTAAVEEDLVAAVLGPDGRQPLGDLGDRGVPVDLLIGPVGTPSQRARQPDRPRLVVVEPQRLLAGVALGARMRLVAADLGQSPPFDLHLDPAVALAQDAGALLPGSVGGRLGHGASSARL